MKFRRLAFGPLRHFIITLSTLILILAGVMFHRSYSINDGLRYRTHSDYLMACDSENGGLEFEFLQYQPRPDEPSSEGFWHYSHKVFDSYILRLSYSTIHYAHMGFVYRTGERLMSQGSDAQTGALLLGSFPGRFIRVPYWAICAILSIPILWHVIRQLFRRKKPNDRRCVQCGYDLRAHSPGARCPECGHTDAASSTSKMTSPASNT